MNKTYVVFDTNVLVSAILSRRSDSATVKLFNALGRNQITPVFNEEILIEYEDVLNRGKFRFPREYVSDVINRIVANGVRTDRIASGEFFPDPSDAVFYEVAISRDGTFLVTGNQRHFPIDPIVVTPAELVEILGL